MHCNMIGETLVLSLRASPNSQIERPPRGGLSQIGSSVLVGGPLRLETMRPTTSKWPLGPRYCILLSIVNCPGPVDFAVYVVDLPASDAALPVANR